MKIIKKLFSYVPILIIIFFVVYKIFFFENITNSEISSSQIINQPFNTSLKNIVNKNSLELIAEKSNAKILSKEWEYLNLETPKIIRIKTWKINGKLNFKTEIQDEYFGNLILDFIQKVDLHKDELNINTYLYSKHDNIILYERIIKIIAKNEDQTQVFVTNNVTIKKTIPFFAVDLMNDQTHAYNQRENNSTLNSIIEIIYNKHLNLIK